MSNVVIIPARLESTRLNKKVLLDICGKSMIQRVYEQSKKAKKIDNVYIATDSIEIKNVCKNFTDNIIMTSKNCQSGTDRIAEASCAIECKNIINIQADEPLIEPVIIDDLISLLDKSSANMVSAMHVIKSAKELLSPNSVKVVVNKNNYAIYFSRSVIPYLRDDMTDFNKLLNNIKFYKHIGVYGYTKQFLKIFSNLKPTMLEKIEKLEQLRAIENGYNICMIKTDYCSIGVDTKEDLLKVKSIIQETT